MCPLGRATATATVTSTATATATTTATATATAAATALSKGRIGGWELVPHRCKRFLPDQIDQVEINNSSMLSKKTSTAESCAEDRILENLIIRTESSTSVLNNK